jgi:Flp pilus assembly protein, ATPase CpaE
MKLFKLVLEQGDAVSCQPLTAEAGLQSQAISCGICGGHSGTGTDFFLHNLVYPLSIISPVCIIHSCVTCAMMPSVDSIIE